MLWKLTVNQAFWPTIGNAYFFIVFWNFFCQNFSLTHTENIINSIVQILLNPISAHDSATDLKAENSWSLVPSKLLRVKNIYAHVQVGYKSNSLLQMQIDRSALLVNLTPYDL